MVIYITCSFYVVNFIYYVQDVELQSLTWDPFSVYSSYVQFSGTNKSDGLIETHNLIRWRNALALVRP